MCLVTDQFKPKVAEQDLHIVKKVYPDLHGTVGKLIYRPAYTNTFNFHYVPGELVFTDFSICTHEDVIDPSKDRPFPQNLDSSAASFFSVEDSNYWTDKWFKDEEFLRYFKLLDCRSLQLQLAIAFKHVVAVQRGFHCFRDLESTVYYQRGLEDMNGMPISSRQAAYVNGIIPAGAEYYEGHKGLLAANAIKLLDIINPNKELQNWLEEMVGRLSAVWPEDR